MHLIYDSKVHLDARLRAYAKKKRFFRPLIRNAFRFKCGELAPVRLLPFKETRRYAAWGIGVMEKRAEGLS